MRCTVSQRFCLVLLLSIGAGAANPAAIEEILVVGARLPRPVQDVVGTVDVVTRQQLLEQIVLDLDGLVRYTPGISTSTASPRFGITELTIRGLSGNRVTTLIDGVPVADQFDIGAFSNAGQDFFTPGAVSRVEILRGPASTLFGSDALGGVVAIVTRDPEEYLDGEHFRSAVSGGYSGADRSRTVSASAAARSGTLAGVLHGSWRESDELDAAGTSSEEDLDRRRASAVAKLSRAMAGGDVVRLKAEAFDEQVDSRPEAVLGYGRQFANTTYLAGDDQRRRYLVQAEYDFGVGGGWAEGGRLGAHWQRSRTEQHTAERREALDPPVAVDRSFDYRVDDAGIVLDMESRFVTGGLHHRLGWGASVRRSRVEEQRDGLQRDLVSGDVSRVLLGERLPVRDFPISTVNEFALYLHDEMSRGAVTLIPGLRFERYRLKARADRLYREDYPATPVEDVIESALVPKLGVQWRLDDRVDVFAQYARGFRAPPFEDVNIGLQYAVPVSVRAIPNPDLKAETSDGLELGVHYRGKRVAVRAAVFGADYDDFIESKASLGFDPASGALLFQSRNVDRARVYGAEVSLAAELTEVLHLDAAASWTRGENRTHDEPLNSVDPPSLSVRLRWVPDVRWQLGLAVRAAAAQSRVDERTVELFRPDGYAVFDLTAGYSPADNVSVNAGLFNLTDRTYWRWGSVRGRPEDDPLVDVLAAPGRYLAASVRVEL